MNKRFFLVLFLLLAAAIPVMAQQPKHDIFIVATYANDPSIIKKYLNDTTGFTTYPDTSLLENLKLSKIYKKLEINTWASAYRRRGDNRPGTDYKNLSRYPAPAEKISDTVVLSKCEPLVCFTACWCPSFFPWYISAQTKNNKILTVADTSTMKIFLSKIDNKFKAYLWLRLYDMHEDEPVKTTHYFKYKKVKKGFLIAYNSSFGYDRTPAYIICFVGEDFKVVLVSKKDLPETGGIKFKI